MASDQQQRPRRILFVGMVDSPHAARWINLIADQGWELHFFPVALGAPHPLMRNVTIHLPWIKIQPRRFILNMQNRLRDWRKGTSTSVMLRTRAIYPFPIMLKMGGFLSGFMTKPLGESDVRAPVPFGPRVLARLIKQLKPDIIHSMEFQHAGYNVLRTKELCGAAAFPTWLATNWGSDIYYYQRFADHCQQISRLLKQIDYYSCECARDIGLAREMGMVVKALPVLPNTGGFDIAAITPLREATPTSKRRVIMVKGYQHFAGRALTALDALEACADHLADYRIIVFSARSAEVAARVEALRKLNHLDISIIPYMTHEQMLEYFSQARIYLGVSISDAISTSMLEAMAMGAFPIQTTTACCEEWNEDGVSAFHIPPDDVQLIAERMRKAIVDDALVDAAAQINWETVRARLDQDILRVKEVAFYDQLFADRAVAAYAG